MEDTAADDPAVRGETTPSQSSPSLRRNKRHKQREDEEMGSSGGMEVPSNAPDDGVGDGKRKRKRNTKIVAKDSLRLTRLNLTGIPVAQSYYTHFQKTGQIVYNNKRSSALSSAADSESANMVEVSNVLSLACLVVSSLMTVLCYLVVLLSIPLIVFLCWRLVAIFTIDPLEEDLANATVTQAPTMVGGQVGDLVPGRQPLFPKLSDYLMSSSSPLIPVSTAIICALSLVILLD